MMDSRANTCSAFGIRCLRPIGLSLVLQCIVQMSAHAANPPAPRTVHVRLSEWTVALDPTQIAPGRVVFEVANAGSIPHGFEVEGHGVEKSLSLLQPGQTGKLTLDLPAGRYETYCPVGKDSHKMLGMINHLSVAPATHTAGQPHAEHGESHEQGGEEREYANRAKIMNVAGGGPVIQVLPGPYPFADSAAAIINARPPDQQADLMKKSHLGPYSNNVAKITGDIALTAIDRGARGDSVSGTASFQVADGARWKVVMDRVQTKDIPFNPRFGGVIMGLFYHGASGVHTPLVPTIRSSLALWAYAHVYKNDQLVTDDAMVHIMLLSRTRRTSDWALDCWDCSDQPIEELQLQVTAPPNTPPFDAPGGFLFVNWEKTSGKPEVLGAR